MVILIIFAVQHELDKGAMRSLVMELESTFTELLDAEVLEGDLIVVHRSGLGLGKQVE